MNTEVINVGNELLTGYTLNRNVQIISKILSTLGININFNTSVSDIEEDIITVSEIALERADLIIYTGGLGPTRDDFTKEVVSKVLGRDLILDESLLKNIEDFFESRNLEMTRNNAKQAYLPEGAIALENENGTAPGIFINHGEKIIILLPGPPREVKPLLANQALPLITNLTDNKIVSKTINTIGIGESKLETIIDDIITHYNSVDIATYARSGQVDVRIIIDQNDEVKAEKLLNKICEEVKSKIEYYIYSYENETIEEVVFKLLKENNLKVGFCESCTGGLVTSQMTRLAGASEVLDRSIVTYSNDAKMEEVSVKAETLNEHGPVSKETAIEMAQGLLTRSNIDIAVSITGFAGPEVPGDEDPVGLVYIGLATKDTTVVKENLFSGSRVYIQERSSKEAFNLIRKHILTEL